MRRALWAVDPFAEDPVLDRKTAQLLRAWTSGRQVEIEPVAVLSPDELKWPAALLADRSEDVMEVIAERLRVRMSELASELGMSGLIAPRVLLSTDVSLRNAVGKLVAHAKQCGAEVIAISSHSEKAVSHFFFGSFAETMILQSDVSALIVSPRTREEERINRVLFPTDLSPASRSALRAVVELAKEWDATLTLFHQVHGMGGYVLPGLAASDVLANYLRDEMGRRRTAVAEWAEEVRAAGARAEVRLDERTAGSTWSAIVRAAEETRSELIAIVSQTGPIASTILGSNTRQVIRHATSPVWVMHPT